MCQYCDQELTNGAKFCRFCGNNLENYHAKQKINGNACSNCGSRILPDAAFCNACGNKVNRIKNSSDNYQEISYSTSDERESDVRTQPYSKRTPDIGALKNSQSVTVEFILGLFGGIIGFFAGLAAIFVGGLGGTFGMQGASQIVGLGFGGIFFSIIGIIGAAIVQNKTKTSGYLMIISAIGGIICISAFYILSFILLIVAGLMAVRHND